MDKVGICFLQTGIQWPLITSYHSAGASVDCIMYKECVILHTLDNPRSMSQGVEYLIHTIQLADASLGGLVPNSIETRTYFYTLGSKFIHQLYINHISFELWPLKIQKRRKNVGSLTNYILTYSYQNYSQTTLYILIISHLNLNAWLLFNTKGAIFSDISWVEQVTFIEMIMMSASY